LARILVTGSQGFVGSHLVSRLIHQNHQVIGINQKKEKPAKKIFSVTKDVSKITNSDIKSDFSAIIHLAAISDIEFCEKNPIKCFHTNVNGTQRMLELARKNDSRFIYFSSSHVFGKPLTLPVNENHRRTAMSIYSSSKIIGESLCEGYSNSYGMNIVVVRPFSIYGPMSPRHNVIFQIISQLLNNSKITLGNINSKRDFIFVNDVIDALILIINSKKNGYREYNLGTGKSTSIDSLCTKLSAISEKILTIISKKNKFRKNDVSDIRCDYSKIKSDFGWTPKTSLEKGLEITYQHYNSFKQY